MAEELEEAPKKGKPWLIPVVVALLLGVGGTVAVTQSDALRQTIGLAPAAAAAPVEAAETAPPEEFGVFMDLDGIVVNPRDTDGRRYFMIRVGVEAEDQKTLDRLGELGPATTDAIIDLMSKKTVEELSDIAQRDSLKDSVRDRFNTILGEDGPVSRIYFTQYVLQ